MSNFIHLLHLFCLPVYLSVCLCLSFLLSHSLSVCPSITLPLPVQYCVIRVTHTLETCTTNLHRIECSSVMQKLVTNSEAMNYSCTISHTVCVCFVRLSACLSLCLSLLISVCLSVNHTACFFYHVNVEVCCICLLHVCLVVVLLTKMH